MALSKETLTRLCQAKVRNQALSYNEFLAGKVVLKSRPSKVIIELTQNCNFKCRMCPHGFLPQYSSYSPALNMSLGRFDRIAEALFAKAHSVDLRGFGESLILPYWPEVLDRLEHYPAINWNIVTNLSFPKKDIWERMARLGFIVGFSCDAGTKEVFESIRLKSRFDKIVQNLEMLSSSIKSQNRGFLYFLTVVQKRNVDDLPNIVSLASRFGVPLVQFKALTLGPRISKEAVPAASRKRLQKSLDRSLDVALDHGIRLELNDIELTRGLDPVKVGRAMTMPYSAAPLNFSPSQKTWKKLDALVQQTQRVSANKKCFKPFDMVYIASDGKVGPCNHLMNPILQLMGDLESQSFDEIWNGNEYQFFRGMVLRGGGAPRCWWCFKHRLTD